MKIALVTPRYPPNVRGGGEISCKLLVESLKKHTEHEITVLSMDTIYPYIKSKDLLNVVAYGYLKSKLDEFDIFHTYNMELLPLVGYLTKKYGIKSVGTFNGRVFSISWGGIQFKLINPRFYRNKLALKYANHILRKTCLSPYEREMWVNDGMESIEVVTNMLNPSFIPSKKSYNHDTFRILYVGNCTSSHPEGMEMFLKIYDKLPDDVEFTIVGDGWEKHIKNQIMNIKHRINYLGRIPNKRLQDIYAAHDLLYHFKFMIPVPIERTLIEAMQSGVCVLTIGDTHYSPIIQDGINGMLMSPYMLNEEVLLEYLMIAYKHKECIKQLGENAKKRVVECCSPKTIVEKYERIYNEVIN